MNRNPVSCRDAHTFPAVIHCMSPPPPGAPPYLRVLMITKTQRVWTCFFTAQHCPRSQCGHRRPLARSCAYCYNILHGKRAAPSAHIRNNAEQGTGTHVRVSKPRCGCWGNPGILSPWYMRYLKWGGVRHRSSFCGPKFSLNHEVEGGGGLRLAPVEVGAVALARRLHERIARWVIVVVVNTKKERRKSFEWKAERGVGQHG